MPWSKDDLPPSVRHQEWSDHQKEVFVKAANAALEEYGDDGKAIAVGTAAAEHAGEKHNASQFPQIFYARHMLPGIAGYESENILIDADAMKRAAPSFVGKPVYVQHQPVDLDNLHNADGYVVECFYNELDGWLWAKCLAVSDEAHRAIAKGWSVSNAYVPIEWDGDGQHLNLDYDRKIRNYNFTHLAIVPNPRYEEAKIFSPEAFKDYQAEKRRELEELQNSNDKPKGKSVMNFFRNKQEALTAGDTILDTDFVEITNDDGSKETVTVAQLKEAKRKAKEIENKKNEKMVDDDEEIDIDGEKVNMRDLKENWKKMCNERKNADAEEEKKKKEAEEAKKKEEEKKNEKKRFEELQNANRKASKPVIVETQMDKIARGKLRYGTKK